MTDQEILKAMAEMLQPLQFDMQGMKADMQGMKADMQGMKADMQGMKADMQGMKDDMQGMKADIQDLKQGQAKLEEGLHLVNLKLENKIEPKLQLIYENQSDIIARDKKYSTIDARLENLENDVFALKYTFEGMKQA